MKAARVAIGTWFMSCPLPGVPDDGAVTSSALHCQVRAKGEKLRRMLQKVGLETESQLILQQCAFTSLRTDSKRMQLK